MAWRESPFSQSIASMVLMVQNDMTHKSILQAIEDYTADGEPEFDQKTFEYVGI